MSKLADALRTREPYVQDGDEEAVSDVDYDEQDKDDEKLDPSRDYINSAEKKTQDARLETYLDNDKSESPEPCYELLAQALDDVVTTGGESCIGPLRVHLEKLNLVSCMKTAVDFVSSRMETSDDPGQPVTGWRAVQALLATCKHCLPGKTPGG